MRMLFMPIKEAVSRQDFVEANSNLAILLGFEESGIVFVTQSVEERPEIGLRDGGFDQRPTGISSLH